MSDTLMYKDGKQIQGLLVYVDKAGHRLNSHAGRAFVQMRVQAAKDGVVLTINSAFRSMAEQDRLYRLYKDGRGNKAAKPGYSNHQAGEAVDLDTDLGKNDAYKWLKENALKFGFKDTVKGEPWHWEYVVGPAPRTI